MANGGWNEFLGYATVVGHDPIRWLDPGVEPVAGGVLACAEILPAPGTRRWVKVQRGRQGASVGEERWILFVPGDAAANGWEDAPASIPASAFVRGRVEVVDPGEQAASTEWLRIAVEEVMTFGELEQRFPAVAKAELATWGTSQGELTRFQDWELWFAPHDDAGYWLIARVDRAGAHVVAAGEWLHGAGIEYSDAWGGHVVLPLAEWREICQRI